MERIEVRIKKLLASAVVPSYAHDGDAGMDLTAVWKAKDGDGNIVYGTGLAFEIPYGYVGLLFPRSSNARRDLLLSNSVGVLDSGYRGEVMFKFKPYSVVGSPCRDGDRDYQVGERIGQIIILPYPHVEIVVSEDLSATDRGTGGYGSTGL